MIAQHPTSRRALRNWLIASIIALMITLAPIVRADTVHFLRTVFADSSPTALVQANITK